MNPSDIDKQKENTIGSLAIGDVPHFLNSYNYDDTYYRKPASKVSDEMKLYLFYGDGLLFYTDLAGKANIQSYSELSGAPEKPLMEITEESEAVIRVYRRLANLMMDMSVKIWGI